MTIVVQRLDQPVRPHGNVIAMRSDMRGGAARSRARGASIKTCMIAAALALPPTAHAAGPAPSQEVAEAPAPMAHKRFGMVRYDRPVYHHGVRVLWHGAWREEPGSGRAAAITPARAAPPAAAPAPAKEPEIHVLADAADAAATRMAAEFASAMQHGGLNVKAVAGKTSPAAIEKAVAGDTVDLAVVPMDALGDSAKGASADHANWRQRAPYLVRLANEPIALVALRAVTDIHQLTGHKVSVAAADGATAASATIVFARLSVAPTITNEALSDALPRLARGEIDAVFVVGADDSKALADFGKDGRFHVVPIPYAPALQALYCPMRLTAHDEPNLIGANDKVDTIAVPTALLAIDAAPDSPRATRIAAVAERLFAQFDESLGALPVSKWKEVNLAARILGWPRFGATQAWLDENKGAPDGALAAFRGVAEAAAGADGVPGGVDSDRLYDSLMKLSGAAR
jgi:TRAP-type uncharacterized transport system substrate-binding protein